MVARWEIYIYMYAYRYICIKKGGSLIWGGMYISSHTPPRNVCVDPRSMRSKVDTRYLAEGMWGLTGKRGEGGYIVVKPAGDDTRILYSRPRNFWRRRSASSSTLINPFM